MELHQTFAFGSDLWYVFESGEHTEFLDESHQCSGGVLHDTVAVKRLMSAFFQTTILKRLRIAKHQHYSLI
jgi:hypothetical protein